MIRAAAAVSIRLAARRSFAPSIVGGLPLARWHSTEATDEDLRRHMLEFQDLFAEARMGIEDATESLDTKYFDDDVDDAKLGVEATKKAYDELLAMSSDGEAEKIRNANAPKMRQLQAEFDMVAQHYLEDH